MKPILITVTREERAKPYAAALVAVGVGPENLRVIPESHPVDGLPALAAGAAGLLLSGGPDVGPERYGEERLNNSVQVRERRDQVEFELLRGAQEATVPVLAICRGMQVANIYLGGSLYQDLASQRPGGADHYVEKPLNHPAHPLRTLRPDLPLGEVLGPDPASVNSRHHQAIKALGKGLLPIAESPDGLLEAVQLPAEGWWLWGVQWHPEDLLSLPEQFQLWQAFATAARDRARAVAVFP